MERIYQWSVLANGAVGLVRHVRRLVEIPTQFHRQGFTYEGHPANRLKHLRLCGIAVISMECLALGGDGICT
jgi:hypothetical protein